MARALRGFCLRRGGLEEDCGGQIFFEGSFSVLLNREGEGGGVLGEGDEDQGEEEI